MSSPTEAPFECHWHPSRSVLVAYLAVQGMVTCGLFLLPMPFWVAAAGWVFCLLHAYCVLPTHILLKHDAAWVGLRHDHAGWALWSRRAGWQPIQLRPDSIALPLAVVLRFRLPGERFARGLLIPRDALAPEQHRRLRLRLKFSRRRWVAPE
ncbi:protein YgfX [Stutzerimonas chloritidismutans]|uniref:protein YgfX n=1 Tax=Stutzerimonas chloritidismutans TaxID=203192 RepID=UPI003F5CC7E4